MGRLEPGSMALEGFSRALLSSCLLLTLLTPLLPSCREYLTGFHKRKVERKKAAIEEIKQRLKQEQKKLREEVQYRGGWRVEGVGAHLPGEGQQNRGRVSVAGAVTGVETLGCVFFCGREQILLTKAAYGRKGLFCLSVQGDSPLRQSRQSDRSLNRLVPTHPQSGSRVMNTCYCSALSPPDVAQDPGQGLAPPTGYRSSHLKKVPHRCAQRPVSWAFLNSVSLTVNSIISSRLTSAPPGIPEDAGRKRGGTR